ncbi:hypothetical protein GEMRC1_003823 [Eukaryota sp. GEM-RC1]
MSVPRKQSDIVVRRPTPGIPLSPLTPIYEHLSLPDSPASSSEHGHTELSHSSRSSCPLCGQSISSASPSLPYFRLLEQIFKTQAEDQPPDGCVTKFYSTFFKEIKKIGSGSFGVVVEVVHCLGGKSLARYACKKIPVGDSSSPWLLKAINEAQLLSQLSHPNIISYKYAWIELAQLSPMCPRVPTLFVLMDLAMFSAKDLVPVSVPVAACLLLDIANALIHLENNEIVHGDVNCSNFLVMKNSSNTEVKFVLSDLGQSRGFDTITDDSGFYHGTREYLPADCEGVAKCHNDDVYSLGVSVIEVVTGTICVNQSDFSSTLGSFHFSFNQF